MVSQTPNFGFNVYDDHDEPGTGSKTIPSTGTNHNAVKADALFALLLNSDQTIKANIIDKGNLKTTVADGVTIEKDATNGLQVKNGGITTAKIATTVADGVTIEKDETNGLQVKNGGITTAKIATTVADGVTIEKDETNGLQVKNGGITTAKIATTVADGVTIEKDETNGLQVKNGGITTAKIADGNVTEAKLENAILSKLNGTFADWFIARVNQSGTGALQITEEIFNNTGETVTQFTRVTTGHFIKSFTQNLFGGFSGYVISNASSNIRRIVIQKSGLHDIVIYTHDTADMPADGILIDAILILRKTTAI
jgi:hypothetical protein